jgi:hypothetical protein
LWLPPVLKSASGADAGADGSIAIHPLAKLVSLLSFWLWQP